MKERGTKERRQKSVMFTLRDILSFIFLQGSCVAVINYCNMCSVFVSK